jgi:hypothetical protein
MSQKNEQISRKYIGRTAEEVLKDFSVDPDEGLN